MNCRHKRQEKLRRLNQSLDRLHREHPVLHWFRAIGMAVAVLAVAMLLQWALKGLIERLVVS